MVETNNPDFDGWFSGYKSGFDNGLSEDMTLSILDQDVAGDFGGSQSNFEVILANGFGLTGNAVSKKIGMHISRIDNGSSINNATALEVSALYDDNSAVPGTLVDKLIGCSISAYLDQVPIHSVTEIIALNLSCKANPLGDPMDPGLAYGLKIEDVNASDIQNFAIYTGLGTVRFGGPVTGENSASFKGPITADYTNAQVNVGDGTGTGTLLTRGAAGFSRLAAFTTGTTGFRWALGASAGAESGADAGSNFVLNAYTDAGVFIDSPLVIIRAANGSATLSRPLAVAKSGTHTMGTTGGAAVSFVLQAAVTNERALSFATGANLRWKVRTNAAAESGADAGSNFEIAAYNDAGVALDVPLSIGRASTGIIAATRVISTSSELRMTGGPGADILQWMNGINRRWQAAVDGAEGGANTGSAWSLYAYTDANVFIDAPISLVRASGGYMTFGGTSARPAAFTGTLDLAATKFLSVAGVQVVGSRKTGWTNQTAVASRADLGAAPTVGALASFCRALYDDLKSHGLIGN